MPDIPDVYEKAARLAVVRCWCGVQHAVPQSLRDEQLRSHEAGRARSIYCPVGHEHVPVGEPKTAALERRIENLMGRLTHEQAAHRATEASRRAEKAAKTRLKKRVAAGVCPCCRRSFANLSRHMAGQHPGFAGEES